MTCQPVNQASFTKFTCGVKGHIAGVPPNTMDPPNAMDSTHHHVGTQLTRLLSKPTPPAPLKKGRATSGQPLMRMLHQALNILSTRLLISYPRVGTRAEK